MTADRMDLIRKLAPDLADEITRRARILDRIGARQPVGRRQIARELDLPEREVRNTADYLRELGYLKPGAAGMVVTEEGEGLLSMVRDFTKSLTGLTDLEEKLSVVLNVDRIVIVPGDADLEAQTLEEAGRVCASKLRSMLENGDTLAVTGGRTIAAVAHGLMPAAPLNVMVVPARGGIGRSVELQANTLASEIASRLGGHYRLLHVPDRIDEEGRAEMLRIPEVREVMDRLERADVVLHGISRARDTVHERQLSRKEQAELYEKGAAGECFGAFFSMEGKQLTRVSGFGIDLSRLGASCRLIAAAAGSSKAEAILSVLRFRRHALLVTDEGAARRLSELTGL